MTTDPAAPSVPPVPDGLADRLTERAASALFNEGNGRLWFGFTDNYRKGRPPQTVSANDARWAAARAAVAAVLADPAVAAALASPPAAPSGETAQGLESLRESPARTHNIPITAQTEGSGKAGWTGHEQRAVWAFGHHAVRCERSGVRWHHDGRTECPGPHTPVQPPWASPAQTPEPDAVADAKALLEAAGYVVLREKSYRQAQERQRVAEALRAAEEEDAENARAWARDCLTEERRLRDRLTHVYGVATRHGATVEELRQPADPDVPRSTT